MAPARGTKYGHRKVALGQEGHWVHRLVLRAFVGEPAEGQVARHLDGNPENNHLSNLAWGTSQENDADRARHGTAKGALNPNAALTNDQVLDIFHSRTRGGAPALAEKYGCTVWAVYSIWRGRSWGWPTGA